jgi:catechol 2,3-dioxygenase-like lactoylglutathione lyase family enzyme
VDEYAVPTLPSRDLQETVAFYARLGFSNAGDPADVWNYIIIRRGTIELHFYRASPGASRPERACFIWVRDVDEIHASWHQASGEAHVSALEDTPYGVRVFSLTDPHGNTIQVGSGPH